MEASKEFIVYDIINKEPHLLKGSKAVADFTGILINHVWECADELRLIDDKYVVYSRDYIEKLSDIHSSAMPPRIIQKVVAEFSEQYKKEFHDSVIQKYPQLAKSKPIYIFNSNKTIVKVVNTYQEVSNHFNVPLGSVKGWLHKIKDLDDVYKYKMCKMSKFNELMRIK